jgi:hypothetical protein
MGPQARAGRRRCWSSALTGALATRGTWWQASGVLVLAAASSQRHWRPGASRLWRARRPGSAWQTWTTDRGSPLGSHDGRVGTRAERDASRDPADPHVDRARARGALLGLSSGPAAAACTGLGAPDDAWSRCGTPLGGHRAVRRSPHGGRAQSGAGLTGWETRARVRRDVVRWHQALDRGGGGVHLVAWQARVERLGCVCLPRRILRVALVSVIPSTRARGMADRLKSRNLPIRPVSLRDETRIIPTVVAAVPGLAGPDPAAYRRRIAWAERGEALAGSIRPATQTP